MKDLLFRILTSTLLLTACLTASAQRSRIYNTADGLPGSRISDIRQDRTGFIWIAGEDGLSRFDGTTFRTMQPGVKGSGSIASSQALSILNDSRGTLWVGTAAGLQTLDPEEGFFRTVSDDYTGISAEYLSEKGSEIWSGGGTRGILITDALSQEPDSARTAMVNAHLPSLQVSGLYPDSRGRIWAAFSQGGFCVIDGKSGAVSDIPMSNSIPAAPHVNCFFEDQESGAMLIGSSDAGLLIQDAPDRAIRRSSDRQARNGSISAIIEDRIFSQDGKHFILGSDGHGLMLYDLSQDAMEEFDRSILPGGAGKWKVRSLMFDSQDNLWVGAYLSGVSVIPRRIYRFERTSVSNCVTALTIDRAGNIWAGSSSQGLIRIDQNGKKTRYSSSGSVLPDGIITALETDRHGNLWIGTEKGIYVKGTHSTINPFTPEGGTGSSMITDLEYDRDHDRIYASTSGNGMMVISPTTGKAVKATDSNLHITTLHIGADGTVWAGINGGLLRYDPMLDRFSRDSLSAGSTATVHCIYGSSDGDMWAGTSDGLFRFPHNSGNNIRYSTDDGLPSDVICSILEDSGGSLWLSTTRGLCRYLPSESKFSRYSKEDGTKDDEFAYRAACETGDGRLIFGSMTGLTAFRPEDIVEPGRDAAPVIITGLRAGGGKIGNIDLVPSEGMKIPGSLNSFTAGFSVLEYTSPDKIICSYKLEGRDRDWINIPAGKREINRERLPAGRYTLKIRAADANMPSRFSECILSLKITAPWYRRWWAYMIDFLIVISALWFVALDLSNRRTLRRREKESGIKDFKIQMASDISEEIRTPLTLVMSPLQEMREQEKDPKRKDLYNMMCRNCQRIIRSLNQMSDLRRLDSGELEFHFRKTDIVYFVKDILHSMSTSAESRHVALDFSSEEPEVKLWIDQGHFDKIIFNLLSNALKHTPDHGRISVRISAPSESGMVDISIMHSCDKPCDTGRIFSRKGDGPGLYLARSLTTLQHGKLSASNVEQGVLFSLQLPYGNRHLTNAEMSPTERHKELYTRYSTDDDRAAMPADDEDSKEYKSRKTIVVAGFDSEIRNYLKSALRRQYNIRACADTRNAWGIISTTIPDAVITGMDSSGGNSLELCSKVKHNPGTNHIPVIILSTSNDDENAEESTRTGADLYLKLPVSIEMLRGSLANVISTRETIRSKYANEIHCDYEQIKLEGKAGGNFIDEVTAIIHRNISNPDFTVTSLSREAGISRVHLNRKLKDALNISPGSLIKTIKMRHAAYLLIHNDANISDVSGSVGFTSPSYFTSSFHEYFGMTPKEFLSKYRGCTDPDTLDKLLGSDWRQA